MSAPEGALVPRRFSVAMVHFALEGDALYLQPWSRWSFVVAWTTEFVFSLVEVRDLIPTLTIKPGEISPL